MSEFKMRPDTAEVGLVLMDLSLNSIAVDTGAAAILNHASKPGVRLELASCLPRELMETLGRREATDVAPFKTHVLIGKKDYSCTAYRLECHNGIFAQNVVALHLEKASDVDVVYDVIAKYQLTTREMEALRGILMGLANKELAVRMNISPNTVKAFLRLIMIKMGVTTRSEMFAKIFANILNSRSGITNGMPLPAKKEVSKEVSKLPEAPRRFSAAANRNHGRAAGSSLT
jgi:DNA-binding CsgD family transcriptional regulator